MTDEDTIKAQWRKRLARMGEAGRAWRKSLVRRAPASTQLPFDETTADELKRAILAQRRARAAAHWSFDPERLRTLLARYTATRARPRTEKD